VSGITPILDTLLHQVLGKRVDIPVAKDQPLPVSAATSSDAIQPARSDSRLQQRGGERVVATSSAAGREAAAKPAPLSGQAGISSSQLHLSPTAMKIADLLSRFPATQTASIRPLAALLLQPADGPDSLASALSQSVRESGVFYESHLQRWMAGQYPRSALMREPQAWLSLTFRPFTPTSMLSTPMPFAATPTPFAATPTPFAATPTPFASTSMPFAATPGLLQSRPRAGIRSQGSQQHGAAGSPPTPLKTNGFAGSASLTSSSDEGAGARIVSGGSRLPQPLSTTAAVDDRSPSLAGRSDRASSLEMSRSHQLSQQSTDALQAVVRHQLELIVAPNLRWEGQLWPGVPMTLLLSELPDDPVFDDDEEADDRSPRQGEEIRSDWSAEIQVRLPTLGIVDITFRARHDISLQVQIDPAEASAQVRLQQELAPLRQRLAALGMNTEIGLGVNHGER